MIRTKEHKNIAENISIKFHFELLQADIWIESEHSMKIGRLNLTCAWNVFISPKWFHGKFPFSILFFVSSKLANWWITERLCCFFQISKANQVNWIEHEEHILAKNRFFSTKLSSSYWPEWIYPSIHDLNTFKRTRWDPNTNRAPNTRSSLS